MRRCRVLLAATPQAWPAMVAASASAAVHWNCELCNMADLTDASNRSSGDHASGGNQQQQQQQQQQQRCMQQHCMQQASFSLGYAAVALLPPCHSSSLGALEQDLIPNLLTSVARLCCITIEELQRYTQVPPPCRPAASMTCPVIPAAAAAAWLPAQRRVCQVHCMVLAVLTVGDERRNGVEVSVRQGDAVLWNGCMDELRAAGAVLEAAVETAVAGAEQTKGQQPSDALVHACYFANLALLSASL